MIRINGYPIDAAKTENHVFDSDVTDNPVEDGAPTTDNQRVIPVLVTLEGTVSDSPIGDIETIRASSSGFSGQTEKPSSDARQRLQRIQLDGEPVTIETSLDVYPSMLLKTLEIPVDKNTGAALRFKATFKQVRIVTNQRTTTRVAIPRAAGKRNLGNRPSSPFAKVLADIPGVAYDPVVFRYHLINANAITRVGAAGTTASLAAKRTGEEYNKSLGLPPDADEQTRHNRLGELGLRPAKYDEFGNFLGY